MENEGEVTTGSTLRSSKTSVAREGLRASAAHWARWVTGLNPMPETFAKPKANSNEPVSQRKVN
jgi:hypothetical protein